MRGGADPAQDLLTPARTILAVVRRCPGRHEITAGVAASVRGTSRAEGVQGRAPRRISASLRIRENAAPEVRADLEASFRRPVPRAGDPAMGDLRHRLEGADDMPARIKAALSPVSLSIRGADGRPFLGTWQDIRPFQHPDQPHRRGIAAHLA